MKYFLGLILYFLTNSQFGINWEIVNTDGNCTARHECGMARIENQLILLGGREMKPVEVYDIETQTWSQNSPPPIELHHFQAVSYNGKALIAGAFTGKYPRETPVPVIYSYDHKIDKWNIFDTIPGGRRRGAAGAWIDQDYLYLVSGIIDGHYQGHVSWVDRYHLPTKTWEVLPDIPHARDHFHLAAYKGRLIAAGGRNSSAKTNQTFELTIPEVDVYDISKGNWTTLPSSANLPIPRAGCTSASVKGGVVLIGGESDLQKPAHEEVHYLNLQDEKWYSLAPLQRGRHGTQAVTHEGAIYVASGSGNRGGGPELTSLERLDIRQLFQGK